MSDCDNYRLIAWGFRWILCHRRYHRLMGSSASLGQEISLAGLQAARRRQVRDAVGVAEVK